MKMMEVGRNGVLLEIVPIQEAIAKEHGRDIVIHPGHLKKAYHVLDPIQIQKIVTRIPPFVIWGHVLSSARPIL